MIRRLRFTPILVSLALGVVINVLVAWGCQYVFQLQEKNAPPPLIHHPEPSGLWAKYRESDWPAFATPEFEFHRFGFTRLQADGNDPVRLAFSGQFIVESKCGFPLRSLRVVERLDLDTQTGDSFGLVRSDSVAPFHGLNRGFPAQPVFPGFVLGALIYALPVWLMWQSTRAVKRRRRLARGKCPSCKYRLTDRGSCPECGFNSVIADSAGH